MEVDGIIGREKGVHVTEYRIRHQGPREPVYSHYANKLYLIGMIVRTRVMVMVMMVSITMAWAYLQTTGVSTVGELTVLKSVVDAEYGIGRDSDGDTP